MTGIDASVGYTQVRALPLTPEDPVSILGLHHITIVCKDAQRTVDFYTGVLGLRLVKKTVNFDAPDSYHLYFGNETGSPGSAVTFFEWPWAARGQWGIG